MEYSSEGSRICGTRQLDRGPCNHFFRMYSILFIVPPRCFAVSKLSPYFTIALVCCVAKPLPRDICKIAVTLGECYGKAQRHAFES